MSGGFASRLKVTEETPTVANVRILSLDYVLSRQKGMKCLLQLCCLKKA